MSGHTKKASKTLATLLNEEREANARLVMESQSYADWAESFLKMWFELGYTQLTLRESMDQLRAIHAKAKGGAL